MCALVILYAEDHIEFRRRGSAASRRETRRSSSHWRWKARRRFEVSGEDANRAGAKIVCHAGQFGDVTNLKFAIRDIGMSQIAGEICVAGDADLCMPRPSMRWRKRAHSLGP